MVHLRKGFPPATFHRIRKICLEVREDEVRITTQPDGQNHAVIPMHAPIKTGTLVGVLKHGATHHAISVEGL
jgi:hypothetical protein